MSARFFHVTIERHRGNRAVLRTRMVGGMEKPQDPHLLGPTHRGHQTYARF